MAIARLPVILVLVCLLQEIARGQQINNLPGQGKSNVVLTNSIAATDPRVADLISSAKNNQNPCGNDASSTNTKQQPTGLQQFLNLQQPKNPNLQLQPLAVNIQPSLGNQNLQPGLTLQPLNAQQCVAQNLQQPLNLQSAINVPLNQQNYLNLQQVPIDLSTQSLNQQTQNLQQPISLQQLLLQQQTYPSIPTNNLQIVGQPTANQQELCLSALPVINDQYHGLPSQVSQGVLLSNLGLSSNLPSLSSNNCAKPVTDQLTLINPQNNFAAVLNAPLSLQDKSQTANTLSLSKSPSCVPAEYVLSNQNQPTSFIIPISLQDSLSYQQNQGKDCGFNQIAAVQNHQYQQYPNQVTVQNVQTQTTQDQAIPVQLQQVQPQTTPSQSVQSIPVSPLQTTSTQNMPNVQTTIQCNPTQDTVPNKQSITSFLLSQMQPANGNYPNIGSYPTGTNGGSKSSSMKALLPLLFNMLKEKNGGCGCPNCNCGCMNNMQDYGRNPCMNNNFNPSFRNPASSNNNDKVELDYNSKETEVVEGYSSKKIYGPGKDKENIINCVNSDEIQAPRKAADKNKYQNHKKTRNESIEEYDGDEDYGDSYENED